MLGALGAPSGQFSPLLSQVFPGTAVSPSLAAPLCWVFCLPPRERVGPAGLCAQGLGGRCSVPGASGVVTCWAARPLIGVCTYRGSLGLWAQAAGLLIWVRMDLGFRCVLGLLIQCSQSRGWGSGDVRGQGCCGEFSKQPLSASIFSFSFREIPPIQAPWSKQAPGLSHSPAWLSPKKLAAALAGGFSQPGPCAGPRDLIVLKHSSYCLNFQCPLQFLVSDLHICWNTVCCLLCSSDQLGVSLVPRGSVVCSHLSRRHLATASL